jgi:hypothetical protein
MKKIIIVLACVFSASLVYSQTATVKGKLIDSIGKQSLKDGSISVLDPKDSTVEAFVLTKDDGSFEVKNVAFGTFLLKISFQGYSTQFKKINTSSTNPILNLGTIYLKTSEADLGMVTVTQSPIVMHKDTTEFNASSFKTKPNAVAEDLLKKLPGVDVDKSGNIKAQGEAVQRVLVDGKRFFGDDPKMATKNLPPDIIDKIQVFDDLSDQSKFTGFDDGNRVKTINITTKKDKRKGYFGKAVVGDGTDGNYDESFNIHRFNGNQQISLLGQGNDINKQNFTQQDILGGGGGGRGGGNGGGGFGGGGGGTSSGITTTWAGGINYRDAWSKDIDASGSYFYNNLHTAVSSQSNSQKILTDSSQFTNSTSNSISRTPNHKITFNFEDRIDSNNSIVSRPNITFQTSEPSSNSTKTTTGTKGGLINSSVTNGNSVNTGFNISGANFQFRHKFAKRFRTLSLDMNFSAAANNGYGNNYSINTIYPSIYNPITTKDTLNQHYIDSTHSFSFSPTLSYTEPIGKNQIIELRYNFSYSNSNTVNNTYDFNNSSHLYNQLDSLFSNSYKYTSSSSTATLSYRIQKTKYNFNVGTGLQFTDYTSTNTTKNVVVARNYINFTPTANFAYNYTRTKSLRLFYNGRTGQPSVSQLQPITTTSDNVNFTIGNSNLKQQFTHSLRALYTSFDPLTQHVFFATINATTTVNDIQSATVVNAKGGTTTRYVNLDGTYNVSGYFNYGFPLKKPKSNLNFTTNIGYNQSQNLVSSDTSIANYVHNYTRSTTFGETVKWTTNLKEGFDMNLFNTFGYSTTSNTISKGTNTNYYTNQIDAEFTLYSKSGWIIASEFSYLSYFGNRPAGYNTSVPLINPSIAKQLFKNKAGEIRLTVYDLLNQNVSVTNSTSVNVITNTKTNVLTRYAMLTFTYNLRNFNSNQQGRMPGMFRGMMPPGGGNFGGGMGGGGFGGGGGGRRGGDE